MQSAGSNAHNMTNLPNKTRLTRHLFYALLGGLLGLTCARQIGPSGGPVDEQPPEIINTIPPQSAVRVPIEASVEIEFTEKIDRETFAEALFVSPDPGGELKFSYSGRRVRIEFPKPLLPERTYVVTIGTDLRDNHNVAMASSYTLAFSTGDSIDRGEIAGQIFGESNPQGILLWAYILPEQPDSMGIDPRKRSGDYVTQAGAKGEYRIPFIAGGKYRVFAIQDQARNGVYDPMEDRIGVPDRDIEISAENLRVTNLHFRMTQEDTVQPVLSNASLNNANTIEVRFDEELARIDSALASHFVLQDTLKNTTVNIRNAAHFPLDPKLYFLITEPLDSIVQLKIEALEMTDPAGNALDQAFSQFGFGGNARPDTLRPKIVRFAPEDSSTGVALDTPIRIVFNEWMQPSDSSAISVRAVDSLRTPIDGRLQWLNPFELLFQPGSTWKSQTRHTIELQAEKLRDLTGNMLLDTTAVRTFVVLNADTLSEIAGTLSTTLMLPDCTNIYLKAVQIEGGKAERAFKLVGPGEYRFRHLLPGVYRIEGFFDTKPNGEFDFGTAVPFVPAERFFVYADSIKIRPRWPNEGNDIVVEK